MLPQDSILMAYQIGFDLYESATQQFLQRVQAALKPSTAPVNKPAAASPNKATATTSDKTVAPDDNLSATPADEVKAAVKEVKSVVSENKSEEGEMKELTADGSSELFVSAASSVNRSSETPMEVGF